MVYQKARVMAVVCFAVLLMSVPPMSVSASTLKNDTRVALQTELRNYIQGKISDGIYTFFNRDTDTNEALRLKWIHPVIFGKNGRFLMCADFIDQQGQDVLIDYLMVPNRYGFSVEKEIRGRRAMLVKMFEKLF